MKTHPRIQNFENLPRGQQWLLAITGKVDLGALACAGTVKCTLDILRKNKPGPIAKAMLKNGWKGMLRPPPGAANTGDKLFYDFASRVIVTVMGAVTHAIETRNAADLRNLADAIEAMGRPADPLASWLVGLFESVDGVVKQTRFPTPQEAPADITEDVSTIRRRGKALGVQWPERKSTEAAHKKRHRAHTALR